jgi:hypothetical protein
MGLYTLLFAGTVLSLVGGVGYGLFRLVAALLR